MYGSRMVGGLFDDLPLGGELQHARLVLAGGEAQEAAAFPLPLQLPNAPALDHHLLLIEGAFEGIVDLEELDDVRPAQGQTASGCR